MEWQDWLEKEDKPKEEAPVKEDTTADDMLSTMQTLGNQNMYQNSSKKKKFIKEAKGAGKKIKQQMGENNLPLSYSNRLRTNIKRPAERVTGNDLSDLDGWVEETKSWESWLEKNNATETSHKKDEKKDEWDGKFSSSTIRDDVKDDDDKAVSEEESLEELTDGKLEEVEKLKSWETWLEKDAQTNRWIETIRKKPTHNSMEDSQSFTRQQTGARYDQDNANKRSAPNSKWDKLGDLGKLTYKEIMDDKGNPTGKYVKNQNAGGSKSNALAHGNKERQRKASTRTDTPPTGNAPTGVRKSWEIWLEKDALNPDSKDKPSLMNTQRFARISTEVRGGNAQGGKLGDASLRGMRAEEKKRGKKYKWKNPNRKGRGGAKKELYHGTERQDGHYPALGTDSGSESGKKFDKLFQEKKSWESWLEKGRWDSDESKKKEKESREAKNELDRIKEWASQPEPKKTQRGRMTAQQDEEYSGNKYPAKKRVPLTRVEGHTRSPVSTGDMWTGDYEPIDTKEGMNSPSHSNYPTSGASDHQRHAGKTGRKEQYITTDNAEKWKSWLEKDSLDGKQSAGGLPKGSKNSGLTPKQRKIQESIDSENDSDNQYYTKAWELWLEKNSIKPSRGQLREGNKPKDYEYRQGADMATMFGVNTNEFEFPQEPKNDFQSQSTGARHATRERNFIEEQKDKETKEKTPVSSPENPKNDKYTRDDIKVGHSTIPRDDQRTAETTKPANRIGMPDIRRRHQITNNLAEKLTSWEGWLEKMQGAGDARFGNQHLTGLDQKPVNNEEDEANILPEKEEKTDNKEEKQEETDNKPYKALGGE
jgi:hypothetical protein